jgi:hypothetical protein
MKVRVWELAGRAVDKINLQMGFEDCFVHQVLRTSSGEFGEGSQNVE